jgi:transcriptional regulator with XRE-family HTH domain
MQSQPKAASPAAEDLKEERAIFVHLIETFPQTLRLSDLIRELDGSGDFARRDSIERAVRELIQGGLLFRCSGVVLPTRAALRAYELLVGAA